MFLIKRAYAFSEIRYKRGFAGGILAALMMYNIVFWDFIPTYIYHKYMCITQGDFQVEISPEDWIKSNAGAIGENWGSEENYFGDISNNDYKYIAKRDHGRYWISSMVVRENRKKEFFLGEVSRDTDSLIDIRTGKVIASSVEFTRRGYNIWDRGGSWINKLKIWMSAGNNYCKSSSIRNSYKGYLNEYQRNLIDLGNQIDNESNLNNSVKIQNKHK